MPLLIIRTLGKTLHPPLAMKNNSFFRGSKKEKGSEGGWVKVEHGISTLSLLLPTSHEELSTRSMDYMMATIIGL